MKILTYVMILALTSSFAFQSEQAENTYRSSKDKTQVEAPTTTGK